MVDAVGDVEDVGEGELRHAVGAVGGDVGDDDAALAGGGGVDHVVARGEHADVAQLWQLCHRGVVDDHFVGEQDVGILGPLQQLGGGGAVVDRQLAQGMHALPRDVAGIGSIAVEYYYLHCSNRFPQQLTIRS